MALLTEWKTLAYRPLWGPSLAWSPDSRVLAYGDGEHTIRLSDVATGQPIQTFTGPYCFSYFLVYSPDGITLASADEEFDPAVVRLWDVPGGRLRLALPGQADFITDLAFSPDGTLLASAGDGVRGWGTPTRTPVRKLKTGGPLAHNPHRTHQASEVRKTPPPREE
jgi:WD40 repeat protein